MMHQDYKKNKKNLIKNVVIEKKIKEHLLSMLHKDDIKKEVFLKEQLNLYQAKDQNGNN